MNKYIAPVIAIIIVCLNAVFLGDLSYSIFHILLFLGFTIALLVVCLMLYGLINLVQNSFGKQSIGFDYFGIVASVVIVVSVVVSTPALCMPVMIKTLTEHFEDGFLNDTPELVLAGHIDMKASDLFLVDGFKFNIPNERIYTRGNKPMKHVQLSNNQRDSIYVMLSTDERLGDTMVRDVKDIVYSGDYPVRYGEEMISIVTRLASKSNYEIYNTIAMTTSDDFKIGASMEELSYISTMLMVKLAVLPANPNRESYYFESDNYNALMFGNRADFYNDNRTVSLVFDEGVSLDEKLYILSNASFDELTLTDDYIPTNIPANFDEEYETTWYEYSNIENEEIPAGGLVFNNVIGVEPDNKLSIRLDVGVAEEEDVIIDQIIFNIDNEYDEIRVRNKALKITDTSESSIVTKELFCGNYPEYTDELVTKDLEFFRKIANARKIEIKFVADGYTKVHEVTQEEQIELKEFIELYELLLTKM